MSNCFFFVSPGGGAPPPPPQTPPVCVGGFRAPPHPPNMAASGLRYFQQDAERARFVVLRSEQEMQAAVIRAEGESESARLISQATKSAGPALVELRRIEAAREVALTLSKSRNVMYLPGGNTNMLLGVNP